METETYQGDLNHFAFDSILKNMSEDDLYNCFINEGQNQSQLHSPAQSPPVHLNSISEGSEFPDLSALDLSELLLQPIKQEPIEIKSSPSLGYHNIVELPEKRKIIPLKDAKITKKQRIIKQEIKVEAKPIKREEKYQKRLQANKRSAQASRERKKALKVELEQRVDELTEENSTLGTTITELETENKVLKNEFIHLQRLIGESSVLSKLMAKANMTLPPTLSPSSSQSLESTDEIILSSNTPSDTLTLPVSSSLLNPPMNSAACMYLMIVLYTFSQHFSNVNNSAPFKALNLNGLVLPPSISTVA